MEAQSIPSLRPLRLGELLDQAIRLYRRNFLTFVGIIAVVYVPVTILQTIAGTMFSSLATNNPYTSSANLEQFVFDYFLWFTLVIVLILIQFFLVQGIASGTLSQAIADTYLGKKTSIVDAYREMRRAWSNLFGSLFFFLFLLVLAIVWWVIVPCIGWFTGLGMIAFLSGAMFPLIAPVVVLEASGPWSLPTDNIFNRFTNWVVRSLLSLRRAWSLARRRFWPLLGYIFVLYLFSLIIVNGPAGIVSLLLTGAVEAFDDPSMYLVVTTIVQSLVTLVATLIYYPLQMTAFTLIYFDLRVRTEGFDIALSTMEHDPTNEGQLMPAPPPATDERLMTGTDLGNFAILTLGAAGIYILIFSFITGGIFFISSLFS